MERRTSKLPFMWGWLALASTTLVTPALAQPLGTFRWQFSPYCNIVTLAVVQTGGVFALDGFDDQCGAGQAASASGTAFPNRDGSIGIGLNLVLTPGGNPSHVDVILQLSTLNGTWRDSAGATGTFVFTPGAGSGGTPRPLAGTLGTGAVNITQLQRRVTGQCTLGQAVRSINIDGTVTCEPIAGGAGDIGGVVAGPGLTGGGVAGDVTLGVSFGGLGFAQTVARSDHYDRPGSNNTGVGSFVLNSSSLSGGSNTAFGANTMSTNTTGSSNTAIGTSVLNLTSSSVGNTGVGSGALQNVTNANYNSAVGGYAGRQITTGTNNAALGYLALGALTTGANNIGIGFNAGFAATTGSNNIFIGNNGVAGDDGTVRIGNNQVGAVYMTGISGQTSAAGVNVFINPSGRLGTITSSARFKQDVRPLDDARGIVQALRPVRFVYRPEYDDGHHTPQVGFIAEEVEKVDRDLVVFGNNGEPETVRYHFLPTLLVAEVQRLERELTGLRDVVKALEQELARLRETPR